MMKNVAGFQSFDFGFFALLEGVEVRRSGLGTNEAQNEVWVTLCTLVEYLEESGNCTCWNIRNAEECRIVGDAKTSL